MDSQSVVGRETELGRLEQVLHALDGGEATCLTVEGEPGIGKTRLLAELRGRAEARGQVVLSGAAAEFERDLPFGAFVDALDGYVASHELNDHHAWDSDLERELGRILPSLSGSGGPAAALADERYEAHRAVRRLLELIADERPLVLVLDDLQWTDGASIELIATLVRRPPAAPVLLALGFRRGKAAERLSAALAGPPVTRLELGHLNEIEAAQLLDSEDARFVAAIYSHAGGNPFYLEQLESVEIGSHFKPPGISIGTCGDDAPSPAAAPGGKSLIRNPELTPLAGAIAGGAPVSRPRSRARAHGRGMAAA